MKKKKNQIESTIELWKIEVQIWINPKTLWFFLIQRIRLWNLHNFWTFDSCVYFSSQELAHGARDICVNTHGRLFFTPKNTTHVLKLWANSSKQHTSDIFKDKDRLVVKLLINQRCFQLSEMDFFCILKQMKLFILNIFYNYLIASGKKTAFSLK